MSQTAKTRIDDVSEHYEPAKTVDLCIKWLFAIIAILSILMPHVTKLDVLTKSILQAIFIALIIIHFAISQLFRFYLVPKAEKIRRQQLLSNSYGTLLTHEKTELYYNNDYLPSIKRLGANTMENTFFSKEIAAYMLVKSRIIIGAYIFCWILTFTLRHNNLELLTWITQVVFSVEIVTQWLNLEFFRLRTERIYDQLHAYFLYEINGTSHKVEATILDAFVTYEVTKASAGLLLSTKAFYKLNSNLTKKWGQIRQELQMYDKDLAE